MLSLNISGLLAERGIDNASRYLVGKGMKYYTVSRLLTGKTDSLTYGTIEQLCVLCNCTPSDLFVWQPDAATVVAADHPLQKLKSKEGVKNPVERIKSLSLDKLDKLKAVLDELERE